MITERTLKRWRRETLALQQSIDRLETNHVDMGRATMESICDRILRMTQELMDQHLLRKEVR